MQQQSKQEEKPTPRILTTVEAAELLGLKPGTLEIWRWNGRGPAFLKIGRACRYRIEDLQEFIAKAVRTSTTSA